MYLFIWIPLAFICMCFAVFGCTCKLSFRWVSLPVLSCFIKSFGAFSFEQRPFRYLLFSLSVRSLLVMIKTLLGSKKTNNVVFNAEMITSIKS